MMLTRRIAEELLGSGTYTRFHNDALPYPDANKLFEQWGNNGRLTDRRSTR
jgi:hypothetical protein